MRGGPANRGTPGWNAGMERRDGTPGWNACILTSAMIRAEFTVFPFVEDETVPPHVQAAIDQLVRAGLDVEVGPLSQIATGEAEVVLGALLSAERAALAAGAVEVTIRLEVV